MVRVKVCGITSGDDLDMCVEAGVDALGFIFAPGPRRLSLHAAEELTRRAPPFLTCVGVFAENDAGEIAAVLRQCRIDVLQFSGGEAPEFCGSFGKPTISVVHAQGCVLMPEARSLAAARAIAVMVDSAVDHARGGTGVRVDTAVAAGLRRCCPLPFILAGGLRPGNVSAAVAEVDPWAVDVRSGVEREGRKDRALVERFVHEAKAGAALAPLGGI